MVRFAWMLGEGAYAHAQRHRSFSASPEGGLHLAICVEISGRPDVRGICFTVPPKYLQPGMVKETGFLIAHGGGKDTASQNANNKLHSELAVSMASQGHVVIRCQCVGSKDSQDQSARMAVKACATSPYGAAVKQWILVGISIGGNAICRVHQGIDLPVIGIVLISLPLDAASASTGKAARNNKSQDLQAQMEVCLRKVKAPILFVQQGGQSDGAHLRRLLDVTGSLDHDRVRMLLINKKAHEAGALHFQPYNMKALVKAVQDYMHGIMEDDLGPCDLPTPEAVAEMVVAYSAALGEDSSEAMPPSGKGGPGSSKAKKTQPGAAAPKGIKVKTAGSSKSGAPVVPSSAAKRQSKSKGNKGPVESGQKRSAGGDRAPGQPKAKAPRQSHHHGRQQYEQRGAEEFSWRDEEEEEPQYRRSSEGGGSPGSPPVRFVSPAFAPVGEEAAGSAYEEEEELEEEDDGFDDEQP